MNRGSIPRPLIGMCYQPAPSDYPAQKYFDTDFYNADFEGLWKRDLRRMKHDLHINFLHLYNWNPQRNHDGFLRECAHLDIKVAVPISNYSLGLIADGMHDRARQVIRRIMDQGLAHMDSVCMWSIGNEYDLQPHLNIGHVLYAVEMIVEYERELHLSGPSRLPITVPVSFRGKSKQQLRELIMGFDSKLGIIERFVACVNIFGDGRAIKRFVKHTFHSICRNIPLMLGEFGIDSHEHTEEQQAQWVCGQMKAVLDLSGAYKKLPSTSTSSHTDSGSRFSGPLKSALSRLQIGRERSYFLGGCLFEWTEEQWKQETFDRYFGLTRVVPSQPSRFGQCTNRIDMYPIDDLEPKPVYHTLRTLLHSYLDKKKKERPLQETNGSNSSSSNIRGSGG